MSRPLLPLALLAALAAGCEKDSRGKAPPTSPLARAVAAMPVPTGPTSGMDGYGTAACRVERGKVLCIGPGHWGQLGRGTVTDRSRDEQPVTGITDATAVCVGLAHACALHETGRVSCWGAASSGQTGQAIPGTPRKGIPFNHPSLLTLTPHPVAGLPLSSQIACDGFVSCALGDDSRVRCWGDAPGSRRRPPVDRHIPAPLRDLPTGERLFVGGSFVCVLTKAREVHCLGRVISPEKPARSEYVRGGRLVFTVESPSDIRVSYVGICRVETKTQPAKCWGRPHIGYPGPPPRLTPPWETPKASARK